MARINTNVPALIAQRTLRQSQRDLRLSLERLSSGLRINRGGDDPAGVINSESLRAEIAGVDKAISNSQRAISIIATTEGALNEVASLLIDIQGLIVESANTGALSREEIMANQLQIDSILASINRLAEATAFGDKKLLNGNFDFTTSGVNVTEATGATVNHLNKVQINAAKIPAGSYRQVNLEVVTASEVALISAVWLFVIVVALEVLYHRTAEAESARKFGTEDPQELRQVRNDQLEQINAYRWVDRERGIVAVPIERAMELLVEESKVPGNTGTEGTEP